MAKDPGITTVAITDTFQTWLNKTNELVALMNSDVVTASPSSNSGDTTVGNATLVGNMFANNFTANSTVGVLSGFATKTSELRQITGNTSPINVVAQLDITAANNTPLRINNSSYGAKISFGNGTDSWLSGLSGTAANTSFIWQFNGSTKMGLESNGHLTISGGFTANGNIATTAFIAAGDGSQTAPTFAFSDDLDTGIYSSANGQIDISLNGVQYVAMSSVALGTRNGAVMRSVDGSASAPAFAFVDDTDTGIFRPGANILSVALGGSERVRFSGNTISFPSTAGYLSASGSLELNSDSTVGVRVGRFGTYSKFAVVAPGTTANLIQLVADNSSNPGDGQIRITTATANYPSYSFNGDTDTGFTSIAADSVSLYAGGLNQLTANTTRILANTGISLGTTDAAANNDNTRHLMLYGNNYGINVKSGDLNVVTGAFSNINFVEATGGTTRASINIGRGSFNATSARDVSKPDYSFLGDTDTGLYQPQDGKVGISINGVQTFRFEAGLAVSSTKINAVTFNATSLAEGGFQGINADGPSNPSFTWTASQTTGMYRENANTIGFSTAGTSRLTISSDSLKLKNGIRILSDNISDPATPDFSFDDAANFGMYQGGAYLRFAAEGSEAFLTSNTVTIFRTEVRLQDGDQTSPAINFQNDTNTGFSRNSGWIHVVENGDYVARFQQNDTTANQNITVMTRIKGDARYSLSSSKRFKTKIQEADENLLRTAFDLLELDSWVWGGEIPKSDERWGTEGIGFVVEKVEEFLPQAARYQWADDNQTKKQPNALDPFPIMASMVLRIRELEERLEQLENNYDN